MRDYEEFRRAIGLSESSGKYDCKNAFGYLGFYQFGGAELTDLGVMRRIPGTCGLNNACFEFISPMTEDRFLHDPPYQDYLFDQHVRSLKARFAKVRLKFDLSGAIAAAHLVGYRAALNYLLEGKNAKDAFGTGADDYYRKFSGFRV